MNTTKIYFLISRYEEIKEYKQINFMKSIASFVDHERQNEKKQLNY